MHPADILYSATDATLTVMVYVVGFLLALAAFFIGLQTPKGKAPSILHLTFFSLLGMVGIYLVSEQARRNTAQSARFQELKTSEERAHERELGTIEGTRDTVDRLAKNFSPSAFQQARKELGEAVGNELKSEHFGTTVINSQAAPKEKPLIQQAVVMDGNLLGLVRDWDGQFDAMEKGIRQRWRSQAFLAMKPADRIAYQASDLHEINSRQLDIDKEEAELYQANFAVDTERLRALLRTKAQVPGSSGLDSLSPTNYAVFKLFACDFDALVIAYARNLGDPDAVKEVEDLSGFECPQNH